jgi:putative PIN family toxin of toxin-antitoxin system
VPPRAVVDNNVPISYLVRAGPTIQRLVAYWRQKRFVWLTSPPIVVELARAFARRGLEPELRDDPWELLDNIRDNAEWTPGVPIANGACRDAGDDKFLSCALEGAADYVVSGDQHLLGMKEFRGIKIVTPKEFVEILDAEPTA